MGEILAVKILRTCVKNPVQLYMHVIPVSGGRDRRFLGLCWPINELWVILKNKVGNNRGRKQCGLSPYVHMGICILAWVNHTHAYMKKSRKMDSFCLASSTDTISSCERKSHAVWSFLLSGV